MQKYCYGTVATKRRPKSLKPKILVTELFAVYMSAMGDTLGAVEVVWGTVGLE